MTVNLSTLLARWSAKSNRRRVVETIARLVPWLVAAVVATLLAFEWSVIVGVTTGAVAGIVAIAAIVVMARRVWHGPESIARQLDRERHTADLLQTAYAIEGRGPDANEPFEPVVLARAHAFAPSIAETAVSPLRLRTSAFGGLVAVGVIAVFVFVDMTPAPPQATDAKAAAASHVLGERDKAKAKAVGDAIDALSKDKTLSSKVRERIERAKDALHRAQMAKTGNAALAALSEASRQLDDAAKEMAKAHAPEPSELAKMARQQLADELAKMAKLGDQAQLSSLAREALRRSAMSP
jgi:hypothetical protein